MTRHRNAEPDRVPDWVEVVVSAFVFVAVILLMASAFALLDLGRVI